MRINLDQGPSRLLDLLTGDPSPALKVEIFQRDGYTCQYCGIARATEIDHRIPRKQGGLTILSNLVAACQRCNREKGGRTPEEWQAAKLRQQAVKTVLGKRPLRKARRISMQKARPIPGYRPNRSYLAELLRAR